MRRASLGVWGRPVEMGEDSGSRGGGGGVGGAIEDVSEQDGRRVTAPRPASSSRLPSGEE